MKQKAQGEVSECPFCGGEASLIEIPADRDGPGTFYVRCDFCGSKGPSSFMWPECNTYKGFRALNGPAAIAAWNRRKARAEMGRE